MANLLVSLKDKLAIDFRNSDIGTAFRQIENWANAYKPIVPGFNTSFSNGSGSQLLLIVDPFGWVNFNGWFSYSGANIPAGTVTSVFAATNRSLIPKFDQRMPVTFGYGIGQTAATYLEATTSLGNLTINLFVPVANTAFNVFCSGARYHP